MSKPLSAVLHDGVTQLHGGSLEKAWNLFELAARSTEDPAVLSEALRRKADIRRRRADWDEAVRLAMEAVRVARSHELHDHAAAARNVEGTVYLQRGEFARAIETYHDALRILPDPLQEGLICQNLGTAHAQQGDFAASAHWYSRSSSAFERAGHPRERILALINQGSVHLDREDYTAAEEIFRTALGETRRLPHGDAELQALAELNIAETLARRETALEEAFEMLLRATGYFTSVENRPHRLACHRVFAMLAESQGESDLALGALKRGLALAREAECPAECRYFEVAIARYREVASVTLTLSPACA